MQAVVFDFDGVLVDSEPLHYRAFLAVARRHGLSAADQMTWDEYVQVYMGFDDRDAFRTMLRRDGQEPDENTVGAMVDEKAPAFAEVAREAVAADALAIPGTVRLIHALHDAGVPLAIGSGATRADIELMLDALNLRDRFRAIVSADDVQRSKPDPQTYTDAAAALNTPVNRCLAIEDTPAGLRSAKLAGLRRLAVTTTHAAGHLADAEHIVGDLGGLDLPTLRAWFA